MSTRAVYTFKDSNFGKEREYHVYKHHDGYPEAACEWIKESLEYAWALPRFEANEFSASFIAANKPKGGGVYLTKHWQDHGDLEFRYEITFEDKELKVRAFTVDYAESKKSNYEKMCYEQIFFGTLAEFETFSKIKEE